MSDLITKICTTCKQELPNSDFPLDKKGKHGTHPRCRACGAIYFKEYYKKNAESIKGSAKKYYKENKTKIAGYFKKLREDNRDSIRKKKAEYHQRIMRENPEKIRSKRRDYHKQNPQYTKASTAKRRAKLKQITGSFTPKQWKDKITFWGNCCYLCKISLEGKTIHSEHRIPISRGGLNFISNIAPACEACNLKKGCLTEKEYRKKAV